MSQSGLYLPWKEEWIWCMCIYIYIYKEDDKLLNTLW